MVDKIALSYDGGIAAKSQLHFYEYSRASYGFARLLATTEHFRRTGNVAQKIKRQNYVDLIISAPKEGSFVTEVLIPAVSDAVPKLAAVPIKALVAYLIQLVTPQEKENNETILELAKIRLAEEEQRTQRSREETKRVRELRRIIDSQSATTREALDLAKYAIETGNRAVHRLQPDKNKYLLLNRELETELAREQEIKQAEQHFKRLDPKAVARLTSRVRPMIEEMGLPLRKSADYFTLGAANDDVPLAYFDASKVKAIQGKKTEDTPTRIECRIRSYDRDAAVGKLKAQEFTRILNFLVPPDRRIELQQKILAAMGESIDTIHCDVLKVVDKSGQATSLILLDVILDLTQYDDWEAPDDW